MDVGLVSGGFLQLEVLFLDLFVVDFYDGFFGGGGDGVIRGGE